MLSQQIKNSGTLVDSIDAIRNWRAVGVLLATLVAMALAAALGALASLVSAVFAGPFVLAAWVLFFYGFNAVGMMMMDEACGREARPALAAVRDSLAISHRLIVVMLLLAALYLAGFVVLALVLLLCKIPFFGPLLYTLVFPVSVVLVGVALCAVPTVVFPLAAPAIWGGAGVMECISQLLAIARKRLGMVLLLMVAVSLIAALVGLVVAAVLFTGVAGTAVVSVPILGGMPGVIQGVSQSGVFGLATAGVSGLAVAAMVGGGLLCAVAFTLPGMVYLRGASTVYLRAVDGLDMGFEQAAMDLHLASAGAAARAKARDLQAQARAAAQRYAPAAAPASATASDPATTHTPSAAPGTEGAANPALHCPRCHATVAANDLRCAACDLTLR